MTPERWRQIKHLFQTALAQDAESRAAFLAVACANDEELRRQVEGMLAADGGTDELLDYPAYVAAPELLNINENQSQLPTQPLTDPLIGRRIGVYQLLRELGRGGMGEVYLANDARLGRNLALKLLPARFTQDAERVRRFQREARAASALNHPNIVTIFDIGHEDGSHYIATEFVEGQTLRALIGSSRLSLDKAIDVAMQIASALEAAHKAGIVHRDIKPENVMVRPDGYAKVLDFGLAKLIDQDPSPREGETGATRSSVFETREGVILGTVSYMSPEQARGQKVDARSDLFSLGVVFYELLTGVRPFTGATRNHILVSILDQEPPPLSQYIPGAPANSQWIVSRALTKNYDDRYPSATDLLTDLKQLKDELAVQAQHGRVRTSGELPMQAQETAAPAITTDAEAERRTTAALSLAGELKRHRLRTALLLTGTLAFLVAGGAGLSKWFGTSTNKQPFARKQITRFSVQGDLEGGAISPDGKYIVYLTHSAGETRSLCVKQVNGGGNIKIADLGRNNSVWSISVSPDSNFVYYTIGEPEGVVAYQVPLLGGQPPRLLPAKITLMGNANFSPDGERVVVCTGLNGARGGMLKLVTLASGIEQSLLTSPDAAFEGAAWSPDGRTIAYIVRRIGDPAGKNFYIAERPIGGGPERIILPGQKLRMRNLIWLPDRRGLLTQAFNEILGTYQIYFASYADGVLHPLTEDADEYLGLSATADGRTILTGRLDHLGSLQVAPLADPRRAHQLSLGLNFFDTLAWAPNGYLIYDQLAESGRNLWRINSVGGTAQQLTDAIGVNHHPCACADGRYIVFTSTRSGSEQVWRINADGGNPVRLTTEGGARPQCSPDGQWVIYESGRATQRVLWKISIEGGTPTQLTSPESANPAISADGSQIAYEYRDPTASEWRLAVMPFSGGAPSQTFAISTGNGTLHWARDGHALLWNQGHATGYFHTISLQPLNGAPPRTLLDLANDSLYWFDLSPDNQQIAYISGSSALNLLLIRDLN